MRSDVVPGASFPDYELTEHTAKRRKLSELQGPDPMVLVLSRGAFCPKDRRQMEGLLQLHREMEVGYCRLVTISTDNLIETYEFRAGVGAHWPFLSDPRRKVQKDLDIAEYTDPTHNPMIPHTIVLEPGLVVHKIYNGYWFFGRPTVEELRNDLRAVLQKCRPDWDITKPELRAAWEKGDKNRFYPYGKTYVEVLSEQDSLGDEKAVARVDILHQVSIRAPPQRVLAAVTTQPGIRSWWTANCTVKPEIGFVNVFRFNNGNLEFHFRVDQQTPRHVAWTCVRAPKVPDEWVDTRLTFELAAQDSGTTLRFGHRGWRSIDGAYADCNTVWGELMQRLRSHAEGKPTEPYFTG
jgi:peroxiredoxin/uncharacterized protein YndB with AHSA1/START domain